MLVGWSYAAEPMTFPGVKLILVPEKVDTCPNFISQINANKCNFLGFKLIILGVAVTT